MFDFITDHSFDLEKTNEYNLSIQVSLDGFSFSITDTTQNKLVALQKNELTISNQRFLSRRFSEWIISKPELKRTFRNVQIVVDTENFTLVPDLFARLNNNKNLTQNLFEIDENYSLETNNIEQFEIQLLFSIPQQLKAFSLEHFNNCSFIHPVSKIINNIPGIHKKNGAILLLGTNQFYAVIFNAKKLLLANNFKISHINDVVYYVLSTFKQLDINTKETELFLTGTDTETSNELLCNYFSSVENLPVNPELKINKEVFQNSLHPFISLIN